jgi:YgiT-type zinc finger domain-containing protein
MKEKDIKRTKDGMRAEYDLRNLTRGKYANKDIRIVGARQRNLKSALTCPSCSGTAKRTKKDFQFERDGQTYKFKDVPVIACDECGEQFIKGKDFSDLNRRANKLQSDAHFNA